MKHEIICFTGHAQNGKDTSADQMEIILHNRGYSTQRISFAEKLKKDAKYLGWDGNKDERGRRILQTLGDVEKAYHGQNYFGEYLANEIVNGKYDAEVLLLTDMRFKCEMELFELLPKKYPDKIRKVHFFRIIRPKNDSWDDGLTEEARHHISEVDLDDVNFEHVLYNSSTIDSLRERLDKETMFLFPPKEGSLGEFLNDVNLAFRGIV